MKGSFSYNTMINASKITCVYLWYCKTTDEYYIGSTNNYSSRMVGHIYNAKVNPGNKKNTKFYEAIRKEGIENFTMEVYEICTKENKLEREQYYYDKFIADGKKLLNSIRPGSTGYEWTEEARENQSKRMKGRKNTLGKKFSTEVCKLKSLTCKHKKAVQRIDLSNGAIIDEFESEKEGFRQTGVDRSSIVRVCQGHRKMAGNYGWQWKD